MVIWMDRESRLVATVRFDPRQRFAAAADRSPAAARASR